jgi:hypothetical protein
VPHITVRESRWLGLFKAMAAVAFVPLHLGCAVNCQQLQGLTFKNRLLYLIADITYAYWLQGLAAVMVITRTTDWAVCCSRCLAMHGLAPNRIGSRWSSGC